MPLPLARRERRDLCDLALMLGSTAPTLCGEWTSRELMAHLLVREHRPLGALGILVPPLAGLTDRAMQRAASQDFGVLVEKVRGRGLTPYALPPVDVVANTLEYLVHHEDVRRAQPGWQPRDLDPDDLDAVWRSLGVVGRMLVRSAGVPVVVRRSDTGQEKTLRRGSDPAVLTGPVVDVALFLFGRDQVRDVDLSGPDARVAALRDADRGL